MTDNFQPQTNTQSMHHETDSQQPANHQATNGNRVNNYRKETKKTNKKIWLVAGGVMLLLVIFGSVIFFAKNKLLSSKTNVPTPTPTKKVLEPVNLIKVDERPFINLKPKADGHNLIIEIATLPKPAEAVEYELEYQTGNMLQGAFGEIKLDQLPITEEVFLGSCSAGGACTYHEDIKSGSLLTRFKGEENYTLKSDFRWWEKKRDDNTFASRDAKFQLESEDLAKNSYVVIFNGAGLPDRDKLEGEIASDIYVIGVSNQLKGKASNLQIRTKEAQASKIAYWNPADGWQYITGNRTSPSDKIVSATNIPLATIYLVVK